MNKKLPHILFISAWYPNRYDAMSGLFVRKHAEAVSRFNQVSVLYVLADKRIKKTEIEMHQDNNLLEIKVYYPDKKIPVFGVFYKIFMFFLSYHIGYQLVVEKISKPDLVHANILTRTGFMALFIKALRGIPYVISEHWSRFLPARDGFHGFFRKIITQLVVNQASCVMPVSKVLFQSMLNHGLKSKHYQIVGNVVDPSFFQIEKSSSQNTIKEILHVSCFDEKSKNIKGILNAIKILAEKRNDFRLNLVGTGIDFDEVFKYYQTLNLPDGIVYFLGEKQPGDVAKMFVQSDVFVLFSRYETAGIVIAESLICGTPVVSTPVGIAPEYINETTGILVKNEDERGLAEALDYILDHSDLYNADEIKKCGTHFSYEYIGNQLNEIYQQIIGFKNDRNK